MNCENALETIYETDEPPFTRRFFLALHILLCGRCARHLERREAARAFLRSAFPPAPDLSGLIMNRIYREAEDLDGYPAFELAGGVSTRGWVAAGLILLGSMGVLFFGSDFTRIALEEGSSFLLPLGIMIGVMITGYGALFIGSHLKELSNRFKL